MRTQPLVRLAVVFVIILVGLPKAYAGKVTISPSNLYYGNQVMGTPSAVQSATVTNGLSTALTINSITINLSDYTETTNCPLSPSTLAAGASCTISATFTPSALGSRTGTVSVNDNASSSPQHLTLHGTGVAAVTATPSSLSFSNQVISTKSSSKKVTVKNNQTTGLTITSITTGIADYSYTTTCPMSPNTLGAGQDINLLKGLPG